MIGDPRVNIAGGGYLDGFPRNWREELWGDTVMHWERGVALWNGTNSNDLMPADYLPHEIEYCGVRYRRVDD